MFIKKNFWCHCRFSVLNFRSLSWKHNFLKNVWILPSSKIADNGKQSMFKHQLTDYAALSVCENKLQASLCCLDEVHKFFGPGQSLCSSFSLILLLLFMIDKGIIILNSDIFDIFSPKNREIENYLKNFVFGTTDSWSGHNPNNH